MVRPACVVAAGRQDADVLAFEQREMHAAEVEHDVADVGAGVVAGEAEVAGHGGADRALLVVEVHDGLLRRPRRGDRAALAGGGFAW